MAIQHRKSGANAAGSKMVCGAAFSMTYETVNVYQQVLLNFARPMAFRSTAFKASTPSMSVFLMISLTASSAAE